MITTKGEHISFDKLLIATGSQVFVPPVKGIDLKGVYSLRTNQDMLKIKESVGSGKKVVIMVVHLLDQRLLPHSSKNSELTFMLILLKARRIYSKELLELKLER